jgi:hypothetical protein
MLFIDPDTIFYSYNDINISITVRAIIPSCALRWFGLFCFVWMTGVRASPVAVPSSICDFRAVWLPYETESSGVQ